MRVSLLALLLSVTLLLGGCMSVTYGVGPRTDRLAQLTPGQSRSSDVLLALGEPRGKGAAHLSPAIPMRNVWFYEFVKSNMGLYETLKLSMGQTGSGSVDLKMLVVFMHGDVYDGYLWFSSVEKMNASATYPLAK